MFVRAVIHSRCLRQHHHASTLTALAEQELHRLFFIFFSRLSAMRWKMLPS
jgi:hypothetical protein